MTSKRSSELNTQELAHKNQVGKRSAADGTVALEKEAEL
jgi:hypothetical protein